MDRWHRGDVNAADVEIRAEAHQQRVFRPVAFGVKSTSKERPHFTTGNDCGPFIAGDLDAIAIRPFIHGTHIQTITGIRALCNRRYVSVANMIAMHMAHENHVEIAKPAARQQALGRKGSSGAKIFDLSGTAPKFKLAGTAHVVAAFRVPHSGYYALHKAWAQLAPEGLGNAEVWVGDEPKPRLRFELKGNRISLDGQSLGPQRLAPQQEVQPRLDRFRLIRQVLGYQREKSFGASLDAMEIGHALIFGANGKDLSNNPVIDHSRLGPQGQGFPCALSGCT